MSVDKLFLEGTMFKVRVGYTVQVPEQSDVDALSAALVDVPDDASHVRIEVVSHWTELEVKPIEEEPKHDETK